MMSEDVNLPYVKPKRKRTAKAKPVVAKPSTSKPVVAAIAGLVVAVADLFLNVRYGIKLF